MRRGAPLAVAVLAALAFGGALAWWLAPRPRPNVVVVVGCTVRRDQLTPYGGPADLTPRLAAFAEGGARFADGITSAPWTRPGNTAIFTGYDAISLGTVEPGPGANMRVLPDDVVLLSEHLKAAGYRTLGVTANPHVNGAFGFAQGFDAYVETAVPFGSDDFRSTAGTEVVADALALVDSGSGPFYLQVVMIDAHAPYGSSRAEARRLAPPGAPLQVGAYRGALQRLDAAVGALLDGLAARGHDDRDTVVVFVNDHGEGLTWPAHHGSGHAHFDYRTVVEMAWMVRGPGVDAGHVVDGLASQLDVLPTLLGMLGLSGYHGPGSDWSSQVAGWRSRTDRTRAFVDTWYLHSDKYAVYTDDFACHASGQADTQPPRSARNGWTHPLQVYPACYDRHADPDAFRPLAVNPPGLLDALEAWRAARLVEFGARDAHRVTPDALLRDRLEALGYVTDAPPGASER